MVNLPLCARLRRCVLSGNFPRPLCGGALDNEDVQNIEMVFRPPGDARHSRPALWHLFGGGMTARRITLITGASGGIGADLARVFASRGHDLALVARNAQKLEALADEIQGSGKPRPIVIALDLAVPGACAGLAEALAANDAGVEILVNNAGFGLAGLAQGYDPAEQIEITDLNIRALTELTLRFLPGIIAARGRILNVASIAAFLPGPGMAVYYASKAYVVSFSAALGAELAASGVSVTALCPGITRTGFQERARIDAAGLASLPGMSAMAVAEAGYAGLMAGRRRVVPGLANKLLVKLLPFVPNALLLPLVLRFQARRRAA